MLFCWPIRIYYEDTDAGGVVYHARYAHFFERARTEMLREKGFEQQKLRKENLAFVVRKMTIDYLHPAKLDDLLTVETTISYVQHTSLAFFQRLINQQGKEICTAEIVIVSIDTFKMKPTRLPESIVAEFKQ
ncbi:Acyl-CoA thioester hydrolase YbgC [Arsenophonus endosymbiont of Aleurodicus floccissimus]|uniref:tol-pal system-associated acyl-CoA thioesterase n=1 Tax=Arsenophonus endosymbiont of Aleurodicus floccissimus TaxID=2152761 RepID=UPI000E6AF348|nr:tol-pal system-associated acyl-CoA thioesterase [Arsenophonus endosymbiont of Aleurodicus floccissimus]SPP30959.1 Acyl-CoA thioester hydrolase YbgC [Arsenophonus endosymbiont of Aleurodicus floccissimus]